MVKSKSKRNPVTIKGPWFAMPIEFLRSRACASLSPHAVKLLLDMCAQLGPNSRRNGDLTATPSVMVSRGWNGRETLTAAVRELVDADLLVMTRRGNKRCCSLFAVTLWPIDCDLSKLDVKPGCYTTQDWEKGSNEQKLQPTIEHPVTWNRPRKNNSGVPATGHQKPVIDPPRVISE